MDSRKKALTDITAAMKPPMEEKQDIAAGSIQDLIKAVYAEPNQKKRQKLIKEFTARHSDAADFLAENEKLINAEAEAALIGAAVGCTITEKRISYKGGRRHETITQKQIPPNAPLLAMLLKNRMPEKYSDKPLTEIEVEDITEMEADVYANDDSAENQK